MRVETEKRLAHVAEDDRLPARLDRQSQLAPGVVERRPVTQTETNVDAVSATNSDGLFRVPSLITGPYRVTITAAGFKKQVRDGLSLGPAAPCRR